MKFQRRPKENRWGHLLQGHRNRCSVLDPNLSRSIPETSLQTTESRNLGYGVPRNYGYISTQFTGTPKWSRDVPCPRLPSFSCDGFHEIRISTPPLHGPNAVHGLAAIVREKHGRNGFWHCPKVGYIMTIMIISFIAISSWKSIGNPWN